MIITKFNILFLLISFLFPITAKSAAYLNTSKYRILDIEEVSSDIYQIQDHRNNFSSAYDKDWTSGYAFNLGLRGLYNVIFFDTRIETFGTEAQLREAGMWWRAGFNLTDWLQVYYQHHSDHILDAPPPEGQKFILENYYGIRLIFYKKGN